MSDSSGGAVDVTFADDAPSAPAWVRVLRATFFAINFPLAVSLFIGFAVEVAATSIVGGPLTVNCVEAVALLIPTGLLALAEWLAFYRRRAGAERVLGWVFRVLSVLAALVIVSSVVEAHRMGERVGGDIMWLYVVLGALSLYCWVCGSVRLEHTRHLKSATDGQVRGRWLVF
jgi:hypothetical protein